MLMIRGSTHVGAMRPLVWRCIARPAPQSGGGTLLRLAQTHFQPMARSLFWAATAGVSSLNPGNEGSIPPKAA